MIFNTHSDLEGRHAFLSASVHNWVNYSEEKLVERLRTWQAAARGTELHEFAHRAIKLKIKLPRSPQTLNMYVNDAIGYMMQTEQILYYSRHCFGTADAISFKKNLLRIHDLKTGVNRSHMNQLMIYAALFCLEYRVRPGTIDIELRIYKNDQVEVLVPDPIDVIQIMDTIIMFDKKIDQVMSEDRG